MSDARSQFNAAVTNDNTPPSPEEMLHKAIAAHSRKYIRKVFKAHPGLDPDLRINSNRTVLLYAAKFCDLKLARYMLLKGADANCRNKSDCSTPLMAKVHGVHAEAFVDLLLQYHADVSAIDVNGDTALHYAMAYWAPPNVIRKLIEAQSDPFRANHKGQTAFHTGALSRNVGNMKTLLDLAQGKDDRNLAAIRNAVTGQTPIQELQAYSNNAWIPEAHAEKARMLEFLSAYALHRQRSVLAAANIPTQRPLPALRKIGRKP